jgi:hypothetical protein
MSEPTDVTVAVRKPGEFTLSYRLSLGAIDTPDGLAGQLFLWRDGAVEVLLEDQRYVVAMGDIVSAVADLYRQGWTPGPGEQDD